MEGFSGKNVVLVHQSQSSHNSIKNINQPATCIHTGWYRTLKTQVLRHPYTSPRPSSLPSLKSSTPGHRSSWSCSTNGRRLLGEFLAGGLAGWRGLRPGQGAVGSSLLCDVLRLGVCPGKKKLSEIEDNGRVTTPFF